MTATFPTPMHVNVAPEAPRMQGGAHARRLSRWGAWRRMLHGPFPGGWWSGQAECRQDRAFPESSSGAAV